MENKLSEKEIDKVSGGHFVYVTTMQCTNTNCSLHNNPKEWNGDYEYQTFNCPECNGENTLVGVNKHRPY